MGGGIWTTVSLQLLATIGVWGVFGIATAMVCFWTLMYFFYFKKVYLKAELNAEKEDGVVNASLNEGIEMSKDK